MVYVSQSGSLQETVPMKKKIVDSFWGVINFVSYFFQSLISPSSTRWGNQYSVTYRRAGSSGGTLRPQRRFGGFGPSSSAPAPPSTCSSCSG